MITVLTKGNNTTELLQLLGIDLDFNSKASLLWEPLELRLELTIPGKSKYFK